MIYNNKTINGNISAGGVEVFSGGKLFTKDIQYLFSLKTEKINRSGLKLKPSTAALSWEINKEYYEGIYSTDLFSEETKNDFSSPFTVFSTLNYNSDIGNFKTVFHLQRIDNNGKFEGSNPVLNSNRIKIANMFLKEEYSKSFSDNKYDLKVAFSYSHGKLLDDYILDINHPEDPNSFLVERNQGYSGFDINAELKYNYSKNIKFLVGSDVTTENQQLSEYRKVNKSTKEKLNWIPANGENVFSNLGVYLQSIFSFAEKGTLTAGLRYDNHSIYRDELNYRFGTVFKFSESVNIKALYGTSFLAPSALQLYSPNPPYEVINGFISNPELKPERASTFEVSLGILPLKEVSLQINGFINHITDFIIIERRGGIAEQKNQGEIKSRGFELSVAGKLEQLYAKFNLSYQKTEQKLREGLKQDINMFPDFIMNLNLNYSLKYFNVNANYHFVNNLLASQNNIENNLVAGKITRYAINKYSTVSLTLSSERIKIIGNTKTGFSFSVKNLFDEKFQYPNFNSYDTPGLGRNYKFEISQYF